MRGFFRIVITLLVTLSMFFGLVPAFAEAEERPEDITFTMFLPDASFRTPPADAPILEQLYEKTGVRIEWILPPAESSERLNIMLATDDMPDLILFWDASMMLKFKEAGKLLPLNDLLETYAPTAFEVNWDDLKKKVVDENGEYYYMPDWYTFPDSVVPESHTGFLMRNDMMIANDYADEYLPKTVEDYERLLREYQALNTGAYPLGLALGNDNHIWYITQAAGGAYGLDIDWSKVRTEDDRIIFALEAPEIKEFYRWLNKLNIDGLLDPESPIMSAEMLKQKCVSEQVWGYIGPWWEISSEVSAYEKSLESAERLITYYLPMNGTIAEEDLTYASYALNMYSCGMTIATKCKDPERFMQFYEYVNSEQGWMDCMGIILYDFEGENTIEATEGYDFIVHKEADPVTGRKRMEPSAWMTNMWSSDENWWWNRGHMALLSFTYDDYSNHPLGEYDRIGDFTDDAWEDDDSRVLNNSLGRESGWHNMINQTISNDVTPFTEIALDPNSEAYIIDADIFRIAESRLPRAIMAASEDAFEASWQEMMDELNKAGLEKWTEEVNRLYHERMESWSTAE